MRFYILRTMVLFTVYAFSAPLTNAQWPVRLDDVPLLPDGTPDLNASTPRTFDGKPDFSGVWTFISHNQGGEQGRPVGEREVPPPGAPPYATFWDQGWGFENGLPYQPWAREKRAERMANNGIENPDSYCLPLGHMQFHTHYQPREIIQSPTQIVMIYEASAGTRQISMDGRELPAQGEVFPTWYGHQVGHWEGDTLVVVSNNFRDEGWIDFNGSPSTEQLTITERFTRVNYGKMIIDVSIDDPGAYTEPFSIRVEHQLLAGDNIIEWVCDNEQSTQYFQ